MEKVLPEVLRTVSLESPQPVSLRPRLLTVYLNPQKSLSNTRGLSTYPILALTFLWNRGCRNPPGPTTDQLAVTTCPDSLPTRIQGDRPSFGRIRDPVYLVTLPFFL